MTEELKEIDEQLCPMCGCVDWDWINCEVAGIETSAKICEECGHVYGGDLE